MSDAAVKQEREEAIKVLLVDDHEHVLWGLTKLIDGEWPHMMVIGSASTVSQARTLMQNRRPDVVVLDAYLGKENALDAAPPLVTPDGPRVILLTGCLDAGLRGRAVAAGAKAVVTKDAPAEMLLTEIERVYREGRASRAVS